MAKAPAKQEEAAAEAAPPKPKSKLILIIVVGLVLVLALGGGGAFLLLKKKPATGDEDEATSAHAKPEAKPTFVKLEAFTVKLMPDEGKQEQQFMQTMPEFKVLNPHVAENVKNYMPEIRHNILLLLSSRRPSELATPQGMEKLSIDIRKVVNQILDGTPKASKHEKESAKADKESGKNDAPGAEDSVQAVLFSTFIIQ
ncbi:MAG: flagellar basal body-associated FliL family protein [Proteobacteria bacterium]|nr:flagellar basal body-associated FliL family protein [Pseudomonadota bacterium]